MSLKPFIVIALIASGCRTAAQSEGKPVPEHLKAKALAFEQKKRFCAKVAKTDDQFSECVGVDWEILKHDQTGLHVERMKAAESKE